MLLDRKMFLLIFAYLALACSMFPRDTVGSSSDFYSPGDEEDGEIILALEKLQTSTLGGGGHIVPPSLFRSSFISVQLDDEDVSSFSNNERFVDPIMSCGFHVSLSPVQIARNLILQTLDSANADYMLDSVDWSGPSTPRFDRDVIRSAINHILKYRFISIKYLNYISRRRNGESHKSLQINRLVPSFFSRQNSSLPIGIGYSTRSYRNFWDHILEGYPMIFENLVRRVLRFHSELESLGPAQVIGRINDEIWFRILCDVGAIEIIESVFRIDEFSRRNDQIIHNLDSMFD